jgi:hypothetical protein
MSMEQLFDQIGHDLGWHDHSMRRDRPYNGQPHTCTGTRGATEIRGVTFRDLRDCFVRAVLLSTGAEVMDGVDMRPRYEEANKGENAVLCENDLYGFNLDRLDPMAIAQNLACEIEKVMGIYHNVPGLTQKEPPDEHPHTQCRTPADTGEAMAPEQSSAVAGQVERSVRPR